MSEMRRLWVDRAIYDNHSALITWLTDQGLSRFYVEVSRENERVLIDVHTLPDKPLSLVSRHDPFASTHRCDTPDCQLCVTVARTSGAVPAYSTDAFRQLSLAGIDEEPTQKTATVARQDDDTDPNWAGPVKSIAWDEPLRLEEDTDSIPRIGMPVSPVVLAIWVGCVTLALVAAFVCVRFWYVKYGCPFWPDSGLLSACKALTIHVGK